MVLEAAHFLSFPKEREKEKKGHVNEQQQLHAARAFVGCYVLLTPHVVISVTRVFHPTHDVRSAVQGAVD